MGGIDLAVERAAVLERVAVWTVFCAPADAPPVHNISLSIDAFGRRPKAPEYVLVGSSGQLAEWPLLSMRVKALRSAVGLLGMAEDARRWRMVALAAVDDGCGEVRLAQYMPSAVVWSIESLPGEGGGSGVELVDLVLVSREGEDDDGVGYRRMIGGPGWLARYAVAFGEAA